MVRQRSLIIFVSTLFLFASVGIMYPKESQADVQFGGIKKILKGVFPPCGLGTKKERFVVKGNQVCDNTTGLWWQATPGMAGPTPSPCDDGEGCKWQDAIAYCTNFALNEKKKRKAWRLAGVKDLISLVDYRVKSPGPVIPPESPFDVQSDPYWSATVVAGESQLAWIVVFGMGSVGDSNKEDLFPAWCVSGGQDAH